MILREELKKIARARLEDSELLLNSGRYDGATYLCGYAVELALKARICRTLKWTGFPSTGGEFSNYKSFKTHSLDVLLCLSGIELKIKTRFFTEWSSVVEWEPEVRYKPVGSAKGHDVGLMIESAKILLKIL